MIAATITLIVMAPFAALALGLVILVALAPFSNDEWVRL